MTPLGGAGRSAGQTARRIREYLEGKPVPTLELPDPGQPPPPPPAMPPTPADEPPPLPGLSPADRVSEGRLVGYYSDSMEGPGQWLGLGAAELGLVGEVNGDDLEAVLAGRHPTTGERLVSAQGSAGRGHLAAGTAAIYSRSGEAMFTIADTAKLLKVPKAVVAQMITEGDRLHPGERPSVANWLRAFTDTGDRRLVTEAEINRWTALTERGVTAKAVERSGGADAWLSAPEAARLVGVSAQYVRRLCQRYADNPTRFVGGKSSVEWIVCTAEPAAAGSANAVAYRIRRSELTAFTGRRRQPSVRCGFDLTLTTEKSFGVLMMLSDPAVRAVFEAALDAGNAVAISYLEEHGTFTRRNGARVATTGLTVATYLHGTSRALDPFPHRHNIVANTALDANGDRKTLDARGFYEQAPVAAALATAQMRYQLTTELGVRWRPARHGGWEIDGITDQVIDEFSTRRAQITAAVGELERILGHRSTLDDVGHIAVETRAPKTPTDPTALRADWHTRAATQGLTPAVLAACTPGPTLTPTTLTPTTVGVVDLTVPDGGRVGAVGLLDDIFGVLAGPDGLTGPVNWFTRGDVIRALVDHNIGTDRNPHPLLLPAAQIERLADTFLLTNQIVELHPDTFGARTREPRFTTVDLLETQETIHTTYHRGRTANIGLVADQTIDQAITATAVENGHDLAGDQEELVRRFCGSGMQIQCAVGPPGSGKTVAMAAAARAWETAGYRVIGAAIKGEAARILGDTAHIPSNTIAWYLAQHRMNRTPFDSRTVVIVDEASTLDDRTLHQLTAITTQTGMVLRLVGDPSQHGAVAAGGTYGALTRTWPHDTPTLVGNRRIQNPDERHTAALVRDRRIAEAFDHMAATGTLIETGSDREAVFVTLARWWDARTSGHPHPMVDRVNHQRRTLNSLAHQLRILNGDVRPTGLTLPDGTDLCVGDEIIAKTPARHLHPPGHPDQYIRNGTTGTITHITASDAPVGHAGGAASVVTVDFDNIGNIDIPVELLTNHGLPGHLQVEWAYAVTSYAVQGATHEQSTSIITPASSQPELYVDITRGRRHNTVIAVQPDTHRDDEPHMPRLPPPPLLPTVANSVAGKPGQTSAYELDPLALPAHHHRTGQTLHQLRICTITTGMGAESATDPILERAAWAAEQQVKRAALGHADIHLVNLLGARPTVPWESLRWDHTLQAVTAYEHRWNTTCTTPPHPHQQAEHDTITTLIRTINPDAVSTVEPRLQDLPTPAWTRSPTQGQGLSV